MEKLEYEMPNLSLGVIMEEKLVANFSSMPM